MPELELREIQGGFTRPLLAVSPPGDKSRLFVVEQRGRIRILKDDELVATPFLDIVSKVTSGGNEQGLLGARVPPAVRNRTGVSSSTTRRAPTGTLGSGDTVIAEYQRLGRQSGRGRHDGKGAAHVRPTGGEPQRRLDRVFAQGRLSLHRARRRRRRRRRPRRDRQRPALDTLLGKILRIDVDKAGDGKPYGIPAGNMTGARRRSGDLRLRPQKSVAHDLRPLHWRSVRRRRRAERDRGDRRGSGRAERQKLRLALARR